MSTTAISSSTPRISPITEAPKLQSGKSQSKTSAGPEATASSPTIQRAAAVSSAVGTAVAALKEATETSVQTAKEASAGDRQAQRILAKAANTRAASSSNSSGISNAQRNIPGSHIDVKA